MITYKIFALTLCVLMTSCGGASFIESDKIVLKKAKVILGSPPGDIQDANKIRFNYPQDAVEAEDGNIYVAETQSHSIRKINKNNKVESFLGNGVGYNGDGDRSVVKLNLPTSIAYKNGQLFIADSRNYLIRRVDVATGLVSTIAGLAGKRGWPNSDLAANEVSIEYVSWLGFDVDGVLWISMSSENSASQPRLYWLNPIGNKLIKYDLPAYKENQGVEISSAYYLPGIGVDLLFTSGKFYSMRTYSVSSLNLSTIYVGGLYRNSTGKTFIGDHTSILILSEKGNVLHRLPIEFANVSSIKKSASDNLLVVDSDSGRIYKIKESGEIVWATGGDTQSLGVVVSLSMVHGNKLLALDNSRPSVNVIDNLGLMTRVAGNGILKWADIEVQAKNTGFWYPSSVAVDSRNNIFIGEQHRIMRVDAITKNVTLFCGYETSGNIYNSSCSSARFSSIRGLAFDSQDRLYVADTYNNQIKRISADGSSVELLAGNGLGRSFSERTPIFNVDARLSPLNRPHGIRVSKDGLIYIADSWNNSVYVLNNGQLKIFAGTPGRSVNFTEKNAPYQGQGEYTGDGGFAIDAKLNTPSDIAICPNGDVLIADEFNFAIRRVDPNGQISTVLGGQEGYSANGSRTSWLHSVVCDESGFFAADVGNSIVWRVGPGYLKN
jgi:sugar lactone lactonase YvrE